MLTTCTDNAWRSSPSDERYTQIGSFNLYTLQSSNQVFSQLDATLPEDTDAQNQIQARSDINLSIFARRRYSWDIECEQFSMTSSKTFYQKLQEISFYFHSNDQIQKFPSLLSGHSHGSDEANIYEHDPTHGNETEFHHHLDLIYPDTARIQMLYLQSFVTLYFVVVAGVFIFQVLKKPQIQDSLKQLRCKMLQYYLIFLPITLLLTFCEICILAESWLVSKYWYTWIDKLQDSRSSYTCTDPSLAIRFDLIEDEFVSQGFSLNPLLIMICTLCLVILTLS